MHTKSPDHHDAELMLRVYELRRESVIREARTAINGQFWPKTYDDAIAITRADHPMNAAFRQVSSYWEMVYAIARHGIVNADYWVEGNSEGLFLFAKFGPHLERLRKEYSEGAFSNAEWIANESAQGRRIHEVISARVQRVVAG